MEIRECEYGIANNFGDYIEVNKHLQDYPKLRHAIIQHELNHTSTSGFTKKDLLHDINETKVSNWELLKFMIHHPGSFRQLLPFYKEQGKLIYDINLIIIWGIIFGVIGISILFSLFI